MGSDETHVEGGVCGVLVYHQISCIKNQDFLFLYLGYPAPYRWYVCTVRTCSCREDVEDFNGLILEIILEIRNVASDDPSPD